MEYVDLYDVRREKKDEIKERNEVEKGEYRLSVHVWIMDNDKVLIQKRDSNKKVFPNLWEQSGGGVKAGEKSFEAVIRECKEELNIDVKEDEMIYIGSYTRINDIVDVWLVTKNLSNLNLELEKSEVSDVKLTDFNEIDNMIINNEFVPTIEPSYYLVKNYCKLYKKGLMI